MSFVEQELQTALQSVQEDLGVGRGIQPTYRERQRRGPVTFTAFKGDRALDDDTKALVAAENERPFENEPPPMTDAG